MVNLTLFYNSSPSAYVIVNPLHELSYTLVSCPKILSGDRVVWAKFPYISFWPFFSIFHFNVPCRPNVWIMKSNKSECNKDATVSSRPERILCNGRRNESASSTATTVRNAPTACQSLEDVLQEMAALVARADRKKTFNSLADRLVLGEHPFQRIGPLSPVYQPGWNIQCAVKLQVAWP